MTYFHVKVLGSGSVVDVCRVVPSLFLSGRF